MINTGRKWLMTCLLVRILPATLFCSSSVLALNSETGNFKAVIQPGTCSVTLNGGQTTVDVDLKSVSMENITTANMALLSSDAQPQTLDVSCLGYPGTQSKPSLMVSGNTIGTGTPLSASLFRDSGGGAGTTTHPIRWVFRYRQHRQGYSLLHLTG